jgi:hypothetical protein
MGAQTGKLPRSRRTFSSYSNGVRNPWDRGTAYVGAGVDGAASCAHIIDSRTRVHCSFELDIVVRGDRRRIVVKMRPDDGLVGRHVHHGVEACADTPDGHRRFPAKTHHRPRGKDSVPHFSRSTVYQIVPKPIRGSS